MNESDFIDKLQATYEPNVFNKRKIFCDTKLLLNLYSKLQWRVEKSSVTKGSSPVGAAEAKQMNTFILSLLNSNTETNKLECSIQNIENSKSLTILVDKALEMLKNHPDNGERLYTIISSKYSRCKADRLTELELTCRLNISRSMLYREKKRAVCLLGKTLWGFVLPDFLQAIKLIL